MTDLFDKLAIIEVISKGNDRYNKIISDIDLLYGDLTSDLTDDEYERVSDLMKIDKEMCKKLFLCYMCLKE